MARVQVQSTRWGNTKRGRRNWKVIIHSPGDWHLKTLVYSSWKSAVLNAHRVARGQLVCVAGLVSASVDASHGPARGCARCKGSGWVTPAPGLSSTCACRNKPVEAS